MNSILRHLCFLLLILLTFSPATCQEAEKPELVVDGILITSGAEWAIVSTGQNTMLVKTGQKLGDFVVSKIDNTSVHITYQDKEDPKNDLNFSFPLDDGENGRAEVSVAPLGSEGVANTFMVTEGNYAVQLLSRAFARNTLTTGGLNWQDVKVVGRQASFQELLEQVLLDKYVSAEVAGLTVICEPSKAETITRLTPAWESSTLLTLDFVNAELLFVLKVLAKESNKDIVLAPEVTGAANIQVENTKISVIFPLLLQLQEEPIEFTQRGELLLVAPSKRLAQRKYLTEKPAHPKLSKKATFDFVTADLDYVLGVLAKDAGLKPEIGDRVNGIVTITAHERSLQEILTMILETQEVVCDWKIEGTKLTVHTRENHTSK